MAKSVKMRAKMKGDVVQVKALMTHPMDTGLVKNKKTGKMIPAHYIDQVMVESGGKNRLTSYWSGGISKNPYLAFTFKGGAAGDEVKLSWKDNKGESGTGTTKIK